MEGESFTVLRLRLIRKLAMCHTEFWPIKMFIYSIHLTIAMKEDRKKAMNFLIVFLISI